MGFWEKFWAPAETRELVKNLSVKYWDGDVELQPQFVYNGEWGPHKTTTVIWILKKEWEKTRNMPLLVTNLLYDKEGEEIHLHGAKPTWQKTRLYYKGELLFEFPRGRDGGGYQHKTFEKKKV